MSRNEAYEACKVYIRPVDPERYSGYTKTLLTPDAVDAIIDCAVQEANELVWKQLNDLAERYEAIRKGEVQKLTILVVFILGFTIYQSFLLSLILYKVEQILDGEMDDGDK